MPNVTYNKNNRNWRAQICVNGVIYHLLSSESKELCQRVLALAVKARNNNTFDSFYVKFVKQRNMDRGIYNR